MLVAASVYTTEMQKLVARWKLEGGLPQVPGQKVQSALAMGAKEGAPDIPLHWQKEDYRLLEKDELGPACGGDVSYGGTFVVYDWDTQEIVWESDWGAMIVTPAGYCFSDGALFVNDLEGANIFEVDVKAQTGALKRRISNPYLNDIHSLERTKRGLLVTCSGTDLILELDLEGNAIYEWWATEHGYSTTPSGHQRSAGRDLEHRDQYYHTRYQTTHLNDATLRDEDERYLLSLLFHQGQLIQIDRSLPSAEQKAEIILDGLARPHGLEKNADGWLLCNSLSKELLLLDHDLQLSERIAYDGGWIQDCTMLSSGRILLNDVDNHRIVEHSGPPWKITNVVDYPTNWRMGELLEVPSEYEAGFLSGEAVLSRG